MTLAKTRKRLNEKMCVKFLRHIVKEIQHMFDSNCHLEQPNTTSLHSHVHSKKLTVFRRQQEKKQGSQKNDKTNTPRIVKEKYKINFQGRKEKMTKENTLWLT